MSEQVNTDIIERAYEIYQASEDIQLRELLKQLTEYGDLEGLAWVVNRIEKNLEVDYAS